jgi:hypothetical protein
MNSIAPVNSASSDAAVKDCFKLCAGI